MKKLIVTFFILLTVIAVIFYFVKSDKAEEQPNVDLKTQIEIFSNRGKDEHPLDIKRIIKEENLNDSTKMIFFIQENDGFGTAYFENNKLKNVKFQSNVDQGYTQYKKYLIFYGKKSNENIKELQITITTDKRDIEKTIPLGEDEYFLHIYELPKEIESGIIYSENFRYK